MPLATHCSHLALSLLMKILVIKLSSLGDLFHALPAVHNLKVGLDAEIHWVTTDSYVDLVGCFADVDKVISFPRKSFFRDMGSFFSDLRSDEYDVVWKLGKRLKSQDLISNGGRFFDRVQCDDDSEIWFDITDAYITLLR